MTTLLVATRKTDKQIQLDVLAEIDRDSRGVSDVTNRIVVK